VTTRTKARLEAEEFMVDEDSGTPYVPDPEQEAELQAERDEISASNAEYVADGSTDVAQAQWLADVFGRQVLYNHSTNRWHVFDRKSGLWRPDRDKTTHRMVVKHALERLQDISLARMGERRRTAELKVARGIMKKDGIEKALAVLSWDADYSTLGDDWDTDPYLLGTPSGVVDLRTGKNLPADPGRRVSMTIGVKHNDQWSLSEAIARAPRFMRFLSEVTSEDHDLAMFYLRWFGYSLFGHTLATKFLILSGKLGFNGKGALKRLMLHVMKDYATELDQAFYARGKWGAPGSNEARADLMSLKGIRAAFLSEPVGSFNTELLKNHTGGDRITARALNSNDVQSWQASHTVTILTNDIPPVSDVGLAVVDRVLVADFLEHFTGNDPLKPGYKDERLDEDLASEGEAVLRILVLHAVHWNEDLVAKQKGLEPIPKRILEASKAYMEQNDAIGPFLSEACRLGDDEKVAPAVLYETYKDWHAKAASADPDMGDAMGAPAFGTAIGKRFSKQGNPKTWRGLAPLSAMALAEREVVPA
jgi:putative DNA primase/helicase